MTNRAQEKASARLLSEHMLPAELEAEAQILGELLEQRTWPELGLLELAPDVFYGAPHRPTYEAIRALVHQGAPTDPTSVYAQMRAAGTAGSLTAYGGEDFLWQISAGATAQVGLIRYRVFLVRRAALRRARAATADQIALRERQGRATGDLVARLAQLDQAERELLAPQARELSVDAGDYQDLFGEPPPIVLPSSLEAINLALGGGYQTQSYVVLNGATKHGKSSLALQEARFQAEAGLPVLVVSVEMRRREILSRLISQRAPVAHQVINRTWWCDARARDVAAGLAGLGGRLRVMEFRRGKGRGVVLSLGDLFEEVKRMSDQHGRSCFVVLDYTQRLLSRIDEGRQDPRVALGLLSDTIAEATRDLGACFFVLSSIPRRLYGEKASKLDDDELTGASAEGGGIEYDAGAVMFLRKGRPASEGRARATLRITAQRFAGGGGAPIRLLFDGAHNTFVPDLSEEEDPTPKAVLALLKKPVHRAGLAISRIVAQVPGRDQHIRETVEEMARSGELRCTGRPGARGVVYQHPDHAPRAQQTEMPDPAA